MLKRRMLLGSAGLAAAPAVAAPSMDTAQALEAFAATLGAHDIDGFGDLLDDGYVNHQESAAAPAVPGLSAKQATVAFFAARLLGLPDLAVGIATMVVSGGRGAASYAYVGTHTGPYFGVPPTGKRLRFTSCDIFRVADGRIAEHWGMGDIAGVLAQLRG